MVEDYVPQILFYVTDKIFLRGNIVMDTSQKIYLGVNLNFAKYVYGHKRALDLVRNEIGAYTFGTMLV